MSIPFTPTVPIGCDGTAHCIIKFYLYSTNDQQMCLGNNDINPQTLAFSRGNVKSCGIVIDSKNWNTPVSIDVRGYSDGRYNFRDRVSFIRLSSIVNVGIFDPWTNVTLPDIKVCYIYYSY